MYEDIHLLLVGVGHAQEQRERVKRKNKEMSFMYLSTSCWSVSTLSKGGYRKRHRENIRKTNDEDVLYVPVHLLLVGVDPVQGQIQKETERESKKDK